MLRKQSIARDHRKYFTHVPKVTVYDNNDESQFYYCKGAVVGEMYPCSRVECQLKYFHLECLKKSWVCPDCRNVNITSRNLKRKAWSVGK